MIDISYARTSLRAITSAERRTLNLDFKLEGSTVLNKLVFKTTNRLREYMPNIIGQDDEHWPQHQLILAEAKALREEGIPVWIGKGLQPKKYRPGQISTDIRVQNTGAILCLNNGLLFAHFYIEDWKLEIPLAPSNNDRYPECGEYRKLDTTSKSMRGQWQ